MHRLSTDKEVVLVNKYILWFLFLHALDLFNCLKICFLKYLKTKYQLDITLLRDTLPEVHYIQE